MKAFAMLAMLFPALAWGQAALDFDGGDDYITFPDSSSYSFTDGAYTDKPFSVCAWAKMDDATKFRVASKGGQNEEWTFAFSAADYLYLTVQKIITIRRYWQANSTSTALENTWAFFVATYDGAEGVNSGKLYINGSLAASTPGSNGTYIGMVRSTLPVYIGGLTNDSSYANGKIGEVLIYNRELSANEIYDLYVRKNAPVNQRNLILHVDYSTIGKSTGDIVANSTAVKNKAPLAPNDGSTVDGADNSMTVQSGPTQRSMARR